ncbi:MAG: prohibitin family protein [Myxococcota bacterium]
MKTRVLAQRCAIVFSLLATSTGCAVVNQGEVGLKRVWGKIQPEPLEPGFHAIEAVSTDVIKVPIRTSNKTYDLVLPSKEGVNVRAKVTVLYRVDPKKAVQVISNVGEEYEQTLIAPVFRSQAADVSARFLAKDLYSAERGRMEREIAKAMTKLLSKRGVIVEAVLLKNIELPSGLAASIEQKLQAEQQAQQMEFEIQREELQAERKRIRAEGNRTAQLIQAKGDRDAQKIRAEGLTEPVLRLRSIEAIQNSPNAKIIITDGKRPLQLNMDGVRAAGPYD